MSTPAQRLRACRQQRWRRRQQKGAAVLTVEVPDYHKLVNALLVSGALSDGEALDRAQVARAIGAQVAAWAAEWEGK